MSLSKRIPYMCIVLTSIKHTHTLNICARLLNDNGDTEVQLTFINANLGQEKHTHTHMDPLSHILIWKGFNSSTKVQIDHLQSKLGN